MAKLSNLIKKNLIISFLILVIVTCNSKTLFCQSFEVPDDFIEAPLIYSQKTVLTGISRIVPVLGVFSKYSAIELSSLNEKFTNPEFWLEDKLYDELGDLAEIERMLNGEDSPLSDPVFDQFKNIPLHIKDTLEQLALNPLIFCDDITKLYNMEGIFYELNCTIPFGFFHKYLILRLQYSNKLWYYKKITSLSYKKMKKLISIAETFKGS